MNFLTRFIAISLAIIFRIFPLKLRWWIGVFLGWLWFDVLRLRRFTVLRNLTIAFPNLSHDERMRVARKSMHYLCYGFSEFTQMPFMNKKWLDKNAVFHGLEHFEKAHAGGRGVLILSLHTGNGDMGIASMSLKGLPVSVISKKFKNEFMNSLWFGTREKMGTNFLEPHGAQLAFEILKLCKKNQAIIFVIDQFMGKPYGVGTTFFGKKTGTQKGLALFALKTKCPVVPAYTYRGPDLKTHVEFEAPIEPLEDENIQDKDLLIQAMTEKYNRRLEQIVAKHKEQWMWVHKRWKKFE
jgi:KDO2-lipid IV(A) lauroyltransferase